MGTDEKGLFLGQLYLGPDLCFFLLSRRIRPSPTFFFWGGGSYRSKAECAITFPTRSCFANTRLVHPWDRQKKDRHKSPFSLPRFSVSLSLSLISMPFDYSPASLCVCLSPLTRKRPLLLAADIPARDSTDALSPKHGRIYHP